MKILLVLGLVCLVGCGKEEKCSTIDTADKIIVTCGNEIKTEFPKKPDLSNLPQGTQPEGEYHPPETSRCNFGREVIYSKVVCFGYVCGWKWFRYSVLDNGYIQEQETPSRNKCVVPRP